MQTSTNIRSRALTDRGFWGQHTLHGLLAERLAYEPDALAVADQPDKMVLVGGIGRIMRILSLASIH